MMAVLHVSGFAQEREIAPVELQKISEHVYQINGGSGANGGLIIGTDCALVIDAKMDEASVQESLEAIKAVTDKPLTHLVNTHSDGDHILGNRFFPVGMTYIAHVNCRADFFKENFGRESDWDQEAFYPHVPSIAFSDRMDLWLGKLKVELYYFGSGHTSGDIMVYVPEEKIVFIGDMYFTGRPQLIHSQKNGDSFAYVKTMQKMLKGLEAETFLSGHSDPVDRETLIVHIKEMVGRQKKVEALLEKGMKMEAVLAEFDENEARLVTSIYNELIGAMGAADKKDPYKL